MTAVERKSEFKLTTDPYLALTGELWCVYCEDLGSTDRVITAPHCILYLATHTQQPPNTVGFCPSPYHQYLQNFWRTNTMLSCELSLTHWFREKNGRYFADDIFISISLYENDYIALQKKFVPRGHIYNNPALVEIMDWRHYLNQWWYMVTDAYLRKLSPHHTTHHTTPYHTTPHHTIPYHTTPHHTIPHHTTPHQPHHTTPHHTIPYHTTLRVRWM